MTSTIIGATKPAQLDDNIAALDAPLPPDAIAALDDASAMQPRFEEFLQQDMKERENYEDAVLKLHRLFGIEP